jgi:BON domain
MKQTTAILSGVILTLALTMLVSSCARRTDKPVTMTPSTQADVRQTSTREDVAISSAVEDRLARERIARPGEVRVDSDRGTVYLKGSVETPQDKKRAGEAAAQVSGVTTVVNQLRVGPEAMGDPARTSRARSDVGQCSMAVRNPAMRTEAIFGPIQVRVFDDVASPLNRATARPYDRREGQPLTAAEISALERQKGRSLTDAEIRSLEMERAHTSTRRTDVLSSTEMSQQTLTQAEIRDLERQKGRPLTDAEIYDLEQQRARPRTEANAPSLREESSRSMADAQAGETGGRQQETGSAQQAGTSQEIGRSRPTSSEPQLALSERDRLSTEQRARLYGDEARIADRRGDLIWSGWLKPNETVAISNSNGPIRYDYRFIVDDRFHDERGAWCNNNVITVP